MNEAESSDVLRLNDLSSERDDIIKIIKKYEHKDPDGSFYRSVMNAPHVRQELLGSLQWSEKEYPTYSSLPHCALVTYGQALISK